MSVSNIIYKLSFDDGTEEVFDIAIDQQNSSLYLPKTYQPESKWVRLDYYKCENCPLSSIDHPVCPLAYSISYYFFKNNHKISFDVVDVEVETSQRTYLKNTTLQQAYSSILGVISALSGCPKTKFLKTMAMFHLPFSNPAESLARTIGFFLLNEYYQCKKSNTSRALSLDALIEYYDELQKVNLCFTQRVRNGIKSEPAINAVILLDILAKMIPDDIENELSEISHIFTH
jgi:hypothetical protein